MPRKTEANSSRAARSDTPNSHIDTMVTYLSPALPSPVGPLPKITPRHRAFAGAHAPSAVDAALHPRHAGVCRASAPDDQPEASTSEPAPEAAAPPTTGRVTSTLAPGRSPPPRPVAGMKLQRVERLGKEGWAGVAAVDRGESDAAPDWSRVALLVGGDVAALLLFTAIGRVSHHEGLALGAWFSTAAPFILGWVGAASLVGGYGKDAQGGSVPGALGAAAKSWALGIPAGLVLRTLSRGYVPEKAFIIVSFVATAVLLLGWRAALAAATPGEEGGAAAAGQAQQRKNKRGNPFEFIFLLASLVKRW